MISGLLVLFSLRHAPINARRLGDPDEPSATGPDVHNGVVWSSAGHGRPGAALYSPLQSYGYRPPSHNLASEHNVAQRGHQGPPASEPPAPAVVLTRAMSSVYAQIMSVKLVQQKEGTPVHLVCESLNAHTQARQRYFVRDLSSEASSKKGVKQKNLWSENPHLVNIADEGVVESCFLEVGALRKCEVRVHQIGTPFRVAMPPGRDSECELEVKFLLQTSVQTRTPSHFGKDARPNGHHTRFEKFCMGFMCCLMIGQCAETGMSVVEAIGEIVA